MIEWGGILWKLAEKLFGVFGEPALDRFLRWRAQRAIRGSSRKKFAILLAKIAGDTAAEALRQTLNEAIRHEFGRAIEITRLTEALPYGDGHESDAELGAYATARRWLADKHGDLLIAGRDKGRNAQRETVLSLQFIAADAEEREPKSYKLTDTLDLPVNFISDLGAAIAARVTEKLVFPDDGSSASLVTLRIAADRLQPIVDRLSPAFDADTRGSLLFTYALVRDRIGELENTTEDVSAAAESYRCALKEWPRERAPESWAMVQNNLGNVLRTLSEREDSTPRLQEGIAALRAALEETTPERNLLAWAGTHFNLGAALRTLDAREGGTAHLEEAITALRDGLTETEREQVPPALAVMIRSQLGDALQTIGERRSDPARLEEAVGVYREALKEWPRDSGPETWAGLQNDLGTALVGLADRESGTKRLEEAIAAFRAALPILDPDGASDGAKSYRANLSQAEGILAERQKQAAS